MCIGRGDRRSLSSAKCGFPSRRGGVSDAECAFPSRHRPEGSRGNRPPDCGVPCFGNQLGKRPRKGTRQAAGRFVPGYANLGLGPSLTERHTLEFKEKEAEKVSLAVDTQHSSQPETRVPCNEQGPAASPRDSAQASWRLNH